MSSATRDVHLLLEATLTLPHSVGCRLLVVGYHVPGNLRNERLSVHSQLQLSYYIPLQYSVFVQS